MPNGNNIGQIAARLGIQRDSLTLALRRAARAGDRRLTIRNAT